MALKMMLNTLQTSIRCLRCANVLRSYNIESVIKKQNYSSWVHRRPVAVVNEEIALDRSEVIPVPRKTVHDDPEHRPLRHRIRHTAPKKTPPRIESDNTYNEDGTPNILKLAEGDRKLATLMMTVKSRKMRDQNKQMMLEGHRLITDAIKAGLKPEVLLFSRQSDLAKLPLPAKGVKLYKMPYATLQLWSNLTTTPGIIGIFPYPESFEKETTKDTIPLTIICDNVREPGNLGSILRAAAGVGCERVILTKGCVDVWEAKVLRSAAGAHFRISISKSVEWDEVKSLISPNSKIFAADNDVLVDLDKESKSPISEDKFDSNDDVKPEELMSASSNDTSDDETVNKSGENEEIETTVGDEMKSADEVHMVSVKELAARIPVIPYYSADYTTDEVVLIVGGETEGLSYECVELIRENGGIRVNVPLTNGVESLNTSMAIGIVAFEVKRQFSIIKGSLLK